MDSCKIGQGSSTTSGTNFIRQIVEADLESGKHSKIITRFPPEPNGFLHLGHAKSICLNFGLAETFGGVCHMRFDDTNPEKEEQRYINSIIEDVRWLGFDWGKNLFHASDYFDQLYQWALDLIQKGLAFVDDEDSDTIRRKRGDLFHPGEHSAFRDRLISENVDLFVRMKSGEFPEGSRVLRAKIDIAHGNMNMRDPVIYRILKKSHPRTGDKWCIYPMYDYAHGQSDSIESITHSICTLEFELHRELYDWLQEKLEILPTRQIEFARLEMTYVMMSKRNLLTLVNEGIVDGWDDPRMPTLSGLRRRGYPACAIRNFCERIGVAKRQNLIHYDLLETVVREALHRTSLRRHAVLDPLKVVIEDYPEGKIELVEACNHPERKELGFRKVSFSRELYIDRDDFMEVPETQFHRLAPGKEVRLRWSYWIKCKEVVKDPSTGKIVQLTCTHDPTTQAGNAPTDGHKVKGTLHWVDASTAVKAEFRLYDTLFNVPEPLNVKEGEDWRMNLNKKSLVVKEGFVEALVGQEKDVCYCPSSSSSSSSSTVAYQFERVGFFCQDTTPEITDTLVFNRTVHLLDTYAKLTDGPNDHKLAEKRAREEAALARLRKKEERERKDAEKGKKGQEEKEHC